MQTKEWSLELKSRVSEIRVKRIRVNRGVGVIETFLRQVIEMQGKEKN